MLMLLLTAFLLVSTGGANAQDIPIPNTACAGCDVGPQDCNYCHLNVRYDFRQASSITCIMCAMPQYSTVKYVYKPTKDNLTPKGRQYKFAAQEVIQKVMAFSMPSAQYASRKGFHNWKALTEQMKKGCEKGGKI